MGETCPRNLEAVGAPPPTSDCQCRSFLFLFVFARELGSLPKKYWAKSGEFLVFSRGYLGPRETFAPPPLNFKVQGVSENTDTFVFGF